MKKMNKFLLIILLLLLSFFGGCKKDDGDDDEIDWDSKTIDSIEELTEYTSQSYEYDEFELSMIKIKVNYTDNATRDIPLTEDMLDEESLKKLSSPGRFRIYLYYGSFELMIYIQLVDSGLLDEDLNILGNYGTVVKAIRNKTIDRIDFIVEKSIGLTSLQFKYTYDNSIMQLSDFQKGNIDGLFDARIEDGYIVITIILNEQITTEETLCSVKFSGTFRTSKLAIDETFDNKIYGFDEDNNSYLINNVLYHASIK